MKPRIRTSLLDYHRDSYVVPAQALDGPEPGGPDPVNVETDDAGTIDCASGFVRIGTTHVVAAALRSFDPEAVARYPQARHERLLKPAILERFRPAGVEPGQLFLGHGSFNLIERVIHKLLRADGMLGVGPQFTEVPSEFQEAGGTYRSIPLEESGYALPVAALEAALEGRDVSILYIDNPNNPLGAFFDPADLERLAIACDRAGAVLLVDEAWGDYVDDSASAIHLVGRHPNLIVVRSFSKALGLAGERVGYMFLSKPLAPYYAQADIPFEPGIVGATLARAILDEPGLVDEIRRETRRNKETLAAAFRSAGLNVLPTHPDVGIMAVESRSRDLVSRLRERGVRVLAGSSFEHTNPRWDDGFCRVRIVERDLVDPLRRRIAGL